MKGKIISINPKMQSTPQGMQQESFTANNKTFYVFMVSVEIDGKIVIGDANSTLEKPKWELNKECEVTTETNDKATNSTRFRFQFGDRQGAGGYKSGGGKSIEERMEIISQNAYSNAIKYIESLEPDERKAIIDKYGPDDAYSAFANKISDKVLENARRLKESYGS